MPGQTLEEFVTKWVASGAAERANKDAFLIELCDALDVPRPEPTTGDAERDRYVFEKDAPVFLESGASSIKKVDLYKAEHFILEAKQGSEAGSKKLGTAKRGTPGWTVAMNDAFGQALGYSKSFNEAVPFLLVCDIGHCIDLFSDFGGSWQYRPFPNAQQSRIYLKDLAQKPALVERLRKVFLEPHALDPSKQSAKVTREVAAHLAELAKKLESSGTDQTMVAKFLMRCLFTMFAEDVGLLPDKLFTTYLRDHWLKSPPSFPVGIESLWRAMNDGSNLPTAKILKFNGGLFRQPAALPLDKEALELLLRAAECDWSDVEPAIFGTLLERALDPEERHCLGAHFTPRAYVERLVKPTIEEPLREEWDQVRIEVRTLLKDSEAAKGGDRTKKLNRAAKLVQDFHKRLLALRVLDPACGTGNFLYVAMDVLKRLESEVLGLLADIGSGHQELLHAEGVRISPEQFLGIEIKPWAKEIAELVLWIGYLQWHFRQHGNAKHVPEPVLRDYRNIECRDAVLAYSAEVLVVDETGKPVTRWDGKTMKLHPATGKQVPDEEGRTLLYEYRDPGRASWPKADFIVGNPPFIGSKRMRDALGDGYVAALRSVYRNVPDGTDYVLYWWARAAAVLAAGDVVRFGFITTNSVTQSMNRRVTESTLFEQSGIGLVWAIADHPWVDTVDGAAVRIAMTVGAAVGPSPRVANVVRETTTADGIEVELETRTVGSIHSDLRSGADVSGAKPLTANAGLCSVALVRFGDGFLIGDPENEAIESEVVFPLLTGRDVNQRPSPRFVIDLYPFTEDEARAKAPRAFQYLLGHVKPGRDQIRDPSSRERWWRFGRDKPHLRHAIGTLARYMATSEVSKHRVFVFVPSHVRPDHSLVVIASQDPFHLGVLSSRVHATWALAAGGMLEDRPRYNRSVCFDPFPFPDVAGPTRQRVGDLAELIDGHRKAQQAKHPELTITNMYNVLEKLRSGHALAAKEKVTHEQGLVSILKQLHDDLDAAVFDTYGWPHDLTDEQILQRLVDLNCERVLEEKRGTVRWLRPEYQNASGRSGEQGRLAVDASDSDSEPDEVGEAIGQSLPAAHPWPKKLAEQVAVVRDLVTAGTPWSTAAVARAFLGADKAQVEDVLEGLCALGVVVAVEHAGGRAWAAPVPLSLRDARRSSAPPRSGLPTSL